MDCTLDIRAVTRNLGPLFVGLALTLHLTLAANIIGITASFCLALLVLSRFAALRALPTLLSNCLSLFQECALVSAVGMPDLMFIGQNISNNTARPIEMLTAVALIYFVIAFPLTRLVTRIETGMLRKLAV